MKVLAIVTLTLIAVVTAAPGWHGYKTRSHHHSQTRQRTANLGTIAATAQATPSLSTLLAAVEAAGLAETLNGAGAFTVFAPNNAAFAKLPEGTIATLLKPENKDQLRSILLKHVLPVQIKAGQIPQGTMKIKTVGGEEIKITNTGRGVSIKSSAGDANVIATDVLASNGIVHVIDTVIQTESQEPETRNTLKTIAATAAETPSLSTLLAAVKAAGLAETLNGAGTFTVFAPNNAAFDKLPEGTISFLLKPENKKQLTNILLRHVLPVQINAGQISRGTTKVQTVGGEEIEITNSGQGVSIKSSAGNANVIATDVFASNGVVHVIDTVIQPEEKEKSDLKSIAAIASATPSLSTLLAAVKAAGLAETLAGEGTFTVFAPNNAAFNKLPQGTVANLLRPENKKQLTAVLLRHVLPVQIKAGEIPPGTTKVKTVEGAEIEITASSSGVSIKSSVGSANVIATDILANNGVVHLVDSVF